MTDQIQSIAGGSEVKDRPVDDERAASLWSDAWRVLIRRPVAVGAFIVILMMSSMAAFPKLWTRVDHDACDITESKLKPSAEHIFGTNERGCDYYSMTVHGARASILVAVLSTLAVLIVGGLLGMLSGFYGRWLDAVLSRVGDIFFALPLLLGALVFLSLLQSQSIWSVVGALSVLGWPGMARIIRASVLSTKNMDYV